MADTVMINRAPVLTLWASIVAERIGHDRATALTLAKAVAGLNAQSKGRMLGIYGSPKGPERGGGAPKKTGLGEDYWIELCDRGVPVKNTDEGVRAVIRDKPIDPEKVQKYLESKFGSDLERVQAAMVRLAGAFEPGLLATQAYMLYEEFRPEIPAGRRGWGAKGALSLDLLRELAEAE